MYAVGKEIDFYEIRRKQELKKIILPAILNFIALLNLILIFTL